MAYIPMGSTTAFAENLHSGEVIEEGVDPGAEGCSTVDLGPLGQGLLMDSPPGATRCYGAYGEASQGVHDLIKVIAEEMAEERGNELGVEKERQIGVFAQRIRCEWGMAAIRARARSRAMRRPLVGCSRAQAQGLVAGSCTIPRARKGPGETSLGALDALAWAVDSGVRMSREARCDI